MHPLSTQKLSANGPMASTPPTTSTSMYDFFTDVANMLKAFIGLNFMVVAYAFSKAGMLRGVIGLVIITFITEHCCLLLVDIKDSMYQPLNLAQPNSRLCNSADQPDLDDQSAVISIPQDPNASPVIDEADSLATSRHPPSFGDIAFYAGGRTAENIINAALILTQFGYCVGYLIFLSQTMHDVFSSATPVAWFVLLPLPIVAVLALLTSIRSLGPFSLFANGALLCGFAAVVTFIIEHFNWTPPKVPIASFPLFFGQMTAALEGIGLIIPVQTSMANKDKFPLVLRISLVALTTILMVVGVLGFATFGADTHSIILLNFGTSPVVVAVKAVLIIGILFTYPLQIIPVFEFAERKFLPDSLQSDSDHSDTSDPNIRRNRSSTFGSDDSEHEVDVDVEDNTRTISTATTTTPTTNNNNKNNNGDNNTTFPATIGSANGSVDGSARLIGGSGQQLFLRDRRRIAIRLAVVASTAVVAVLAGASFGVFQALVGSMGASVLAYTAPALFHLLTFRDRLSRFGKVKNGAIVAFGILGGVAGTIASLWEMVEIHRGNATPA